MYTLRTLARQKNDVGAIDLEHLEVLAPYMPIEVRKQFVSDHGANPEFVAQYGDLDLTVLTWTQQSICAKNLVAASVHGPFVQWYNSVASRATLVASEGWFAIDKRPEVSRHWEVNRTWLVPPVLLRGNVLGKPSLFHVVEGHTRLGLLAGLCTAGLCDPGRTHEAWVGEVRRDDA